MTTEARVLEGRGSGASAAGPFVGRERLLGDLLAAAEAARGGRGCAWWLAGDAGMGKTRTATALAARARGFRPAPVSFRCEGEYWYISFAGRVVHLRDQIGLHHIAELLRQPGRDLPAVDLLAAAGERHSARGLPTAGDAGPLLDAQARNAYRTRVRELGAELEEAESFGDLGRAERLRDEIEALDGEVRRAVGLAGRARTAGSHAERARINVTRTVRAALRKIAAAHPELGLHLEATLRTGTFLSYRPDPAIGDRWEW